MKKLTPKQIDRQNRLKESLARGPVIPVSVNNLLSSRSVVSNGTTPSINAGLKKSKIQAPAHVNNFETNIPVVARSNNHSETKTKMIVESAPSVNGKQAPELVHKTIKHQLTDEPPVISRNVKKTKT